MLYVLCCSVWYLYAKWKNNTRRFTSAHTTWCSCFTRVHVCQLFVLLSSDTRTCRHVTWRNTGLKTVSHYIYVRLYQQPCARYSGPTTLNKGRRNSWLIKFRIVVLFKNYSIWWQIERFYSKNMFFKNCKLLRMQLILSTTSMLKSCWLFSLWVPGCPYIIW